MNKASERQAKYDAKATKRYGLKLNRNTDKDVIDRLDQESSMQGYIKDLINRDIQASKASFLACKIVDFESEGYRLKEISSNNLERTALLTKGSEEIRIIETDDPNILTLEIDGKRDNCNR